jgi:hypothetical protein
MLANEVLDLIESVLLPEFESRSEKIRNEILEVEAKYAGGSYFSSGREKSIRNLCELKLEDLANRIWEIIIKVVQTCEDSYSSVASIDLKETFSKYYKECCTEPVCSLLTSKISPQGRIRYANSFYEKANRLESQYFGKIELWIREQQSKMQDNKTALCELPENAIVGEVNYEKGLSFLKDKGLKASIESDCDEINKIANVGAAKSVIILCGSVVEAILYDLLKGDEKRAKEVAEKLSIMPENNSIKYILDSASRKKLNEWTLLPLLKVAKRQYSNKVREDVVVYSDVLRDYRNLIHPGKAERSEKKADNHTATMAITVLNLLISGLK